MGGCAGWPCRLSFDNVVLCFFLCNEVMLKISWFYVCYCTALKYCNRDAQANNPVQDQTAPWQTVQSRSDCSMANSEIPDQTAPWQTVQSRIKQLYRN